MRRYGKHLLKVWVLEYGDRDSFTVKVCDNAKLTPEMWDGVVMCLQDMIKRKFPQIPEEVAQ